jgi:hypothetical protein
MDSDAGSTLPDAVAKLAATKAEHRKILQTVAGDPGMAPETRQTLIEHLYQEEDEQVRRIASLLGGGGGATESAPGEGGDDRPTLTVGSLRREALPGPRLGSLRPELRKK